MALGVRPLPFVLESFFGLLARRQRSHRAYRLVRLFVISPAFPITVFTLAYTQHLIALFFLLALLIAFLLCNRS